MRMDLADLRLFLMVVEAGSITAGAERAHLALASTSERLRTMEAEAGIALLTRHPRGVTTTEAGEALAHHARLMLRQQSLLREELQEFASGARGTLHLYANTGALTTFLPGRLAPWMAARPRLHVDLKERTSKEIVRAVRGGQAEAGITSDAVDSAPLQLQPVADDPLLLIVPPNHRLVARTAIRFAEVLGDTFVALADGNALQEHIEDNARTLGRSLSPRIRMKTFEGVCEMVGHGIGIGIVPRSICRQHRRRYRFHAIALEDAWARRQLSLCFVRWNGLSRSMQSLLLHLGGHAVED
ncbi:LysR family transcriptional regulator [Stenotrophomonas sp. Betaine-02u-21]|uniref:LysR family transcriptional regulator n=1 Tax=unclassified Stenotrophomonas TaxID=196198 RepID=UPI000C31DC5F|nr:MULTISPECIES: LysR family transcriptional regulator [unclassified Stenotrophomonas]PKH71787.1 LysR family transcriptional regulator [Stenotrophomonas sp. Betaine-02u-23]PKH73335.1 LysR family transcriptional regulator [Stenotrophomonas sp. Betaine-02u-21]PKH95732.1 LysR family transcriptional regulator [Stenotrophomonas sp. Bg11-02]